RLFAGAGEPQCDGPADARAGLLHTAGAGVTRMREDNMQTASRTLRARRPDWRGALLALCTALAFGLPAVAAEPVYLRIPHKAMGTTQAVALEVNKSVLVDLPTNAGEVIASQPSVATVVMRSKTRAIVQGVSGGDTNIFFLDAVGNSIA